MTTTLFIDGSEALAGDMLVAALVDLGVEHARIQERLGGIELQGYRTQIETVMRGPFRALHFCVSPSEDTAQEDDASAREQPLHAHPEPYFGAQSHRYWHDIRQLLTNSRALLGAGVVDRALAVFECLANAEARIHGVEPEKVHFHEVGAVDSIVDIVAACMP